MSFQPMDLKFFKIQQHDSLKHSYGWLQGKVAHFLRHNLIFCKVTCIYMLLTWHKNNNFPKFWLYLYCQLKQKKIYKKNCNIYTPKIYNTWLLKLKNMDWFIVCAFLYMHFCVWILFRIYYRDSIYDMFLKKKHMCKKISRK